MIRQCIASKGKKTLDPRCGAGWEMRLAGDSGGGAPVDAREDNAESAALQEQGDVVAPLIFGWQKK